MRKGEGKIKVKNLFKEKTKFVQMNILNLEQRLATQSQYQRQKNANELAECREKRLFNHHQYQTEKKIIYESADHIRQERLANQHQYQNEKNAYSSTITDEIRKFHATVRTVSYICSLLTSCGINTVSLLLKTLYFPTLL